MKDDCYGMPARQRKVKWVHCPHCLRTWGLLSSKVCKLCGTSLKDGEAPETKFNMATLIKEVG